MRCALERVGVRFHVTGQDNLRQMSSPVVFVANHMSALETQILPSVLEGAGRCTFVVKSSLLTLPVFGTVLKGFDPIAIGRNNAREDLQTVLVEGQSRIAGGQSVIVFPQGRRSIDFDPRRFNSLGMRLARRSCVPLVPIALYTEAWEIGSLLSDIGRIVPSRLVRIAIGEAIPPCAESKTMHETSLGFIESHIRNWEVERQAAALRPRL